MLFLKRLNDVFEDKSKLLEDKHGRVAWTDPDLHAFFIPEKARWSTIRKTVENIGEVLDKACIEIEQKNPSLKDVLTYIKYNDKNNYSDSALNELITHFDQKNMRLGESNLENEDIFGQAYEYLLEQFADSAGQKDGQFFTPREVVDLMVQLLNPQEKMRICDPTCGSGGMLIRTWKYIKENGGNPKNITLHGQEKSRGTRGMCIMNMVVHGIENFKIENGDLHSNPMLTEKGRLIKYDRVIANYPFGRDWNSDAGKSDPYGRYVFGIPSSNGKADYAFIQEMYSHLSEKGQAAIVCAQGVLFRGGAEGSIREAFIKNDIIDTVIALPSNLFYGPTIPAVILFLDKNKPKNRKKKILFIYAAKDFADLKKQNKLRDSDIEKILSAVNSYKSVYGYSYVANLDEIEENQFNLNVPRYIDITDPEEEINIQDAYDDVKKSMKNRTKLEKQILSDLKELDVEI